MPILKLLILTLIIVVFAVAALSVRIIFSKDKQFHGGSCSTSPGLQDKGIGCGCGSEKCES